MVRRTDQHLHQQRNWLRVDIPVAFETPQPSAATFWGFTLIGLYVGVIPVFLGIFWFPALRTLGRRTMTFLMAATAGLLIFLGLDTLAEAFEFAAEVPRHISRHWSDRHRRGGNLPFAGCNFKATNRHIGR